MEITQEQLKTLTGEQWKSKAFRGLITANKCPECEGKGFVLDDSELYTRSSKFPAGYYKKEICQSCNGTGFPTIEIEKEWVECRNKGDGSLHSKLCSCNGKGKIQKYKVGDEIETLDCMLNEEEHGKSMVKIIKLKIFSEKGDKWIVGMVR